MLSSSSVTNPQEHSFTVKIAQTPEEIQQLLETGFEYVLQKDNLIFLRERK
jgi:hypothetical protein